MHAVVVVQGTGADQGVDESLHLRQAERIAQSRAFGPSLLKGGTHGEIAPVVVHFLKAGSAQILGHHFFELQIPRGNELRHLLRVQKMLFHDVAPSSFCSSLNFASTIW